MGPRLKRSIVIRKLTSSCDFGRRGKVYVILFTNGNGIWAAPADLSMFLEDEAVLQKLDKKTLFKGSGRERVLNEALAEARRVGQIRAAGGTEAGSVERGESDREVEPGARGGAGRHVARSQESRQIGNGSGGVNTDGGLVTPEGETGVALEGVKTGRGALTLEERERRRKGKRKVDVSSDDEIEEEVPALVRRGKRVKETPRRRCPGESPGGNGRSDGGHVDAGSRGPRNGSVARSLDLASVEEELTDIREQELDRILEGVSLEGVSEPPNADMGFEPVGAELSDEEDPFGDGRIVGRGTKRRRSAVVSDDEEAEAVEDCRGDRQNWLTPERNSEPPGTVTERVANVSLEGEEAQNGGHVTKNDVSGLPAGSPSEDATLPQKNPEEPAGQQGTLLGAAALTHGSPGESPGKTGALTFATGAVTFAPISPPPGIRSPAGQDTNPGQSGRTVGGSSSDEEGASEREPHQRATMTPPASAVKREEAARVSETRPDSAAGFVGMRSENMRPLSGEQTQGAHDPANGRSPRGGGVDRQEIPEEAAQAQAAVGSPAPSNEVSELTEYLKDAFVPEPAIEHLIEAGYTMRNLKAGGLAWDMLDKPLKRGALSASILSVGTRTLLDQASDLYKSAHCQLV